MASANSAALPSRGYGVDMKRRDFLKIFLLGGIFSLFSRKVGAENKAEKKQEHKLKEAMFWKRLD